MKASLKYIILFFILLYSWVTYAQNAWIDSVKKVTTTQKAGTNKVNSLINLSKLKAKFDIMSCINEGTEVNLNFKIT